MSYVCAKGHTEGRGANGSCKVCKREYMRNAYYPKNANRIAATAADWAKRNSERRREIQKQYVERNLEKVRAKHKAYRDADPARELAKCRKRQAALLKRTPPWANHIAILDVYRQAAAITKATGVPQHVDHEIPLRGRLVSGLHVHTNLQILPAHANVAKGKRFGGVW